MNDRRDARGFLHAEVLLFHGVCPGISSNLAITAVAEASEHSAPLVRRVHELVSPQREQQLKALTRRE